MTAAPSVPHLSCCQCGNPIDPHGPYRQHVDSGLYEHCFPTFCEKARRAAAQLFGPLEILTLAAVRNHVESSIRALELRARDEWRAEYLAKRAGDGKAAADHDTTALRAWADMEPLKARRCWLIAQIEHADREMSEEHDRGQR